LENITIAIACELAPGKTFIPIIKRLKELEKDEKLNWQKSKIITLTHGHGVEKLIEHYSDEIYSIGEGRASGGVKRNNLQLAYLIAKDIFKAFFALRKKDIDLLITCGNAGDVRKSIIAAKLLKIPVIHIEQDIYNPIETIAYSNLITVPNEKYNDFLKENYYININNDNGNDESVGLKNIHGYPMATYVNDFAYEGNLIANEEILEKYGFKEFILVFLGGDLKIDDIKSLILAIEKADFPTLIVPYRFDKELIEDLIVSNKVKVIGEVVNLLSLIKSAKLMIYGAGMGITIEAGVLEIPSIKIAGFHKKHGSVDLANELNIPIIEIDELSQLLSDFNNVNISKPNGEKILKNSQIAIEEIIEIINNFDLKNPPKSSGFKSMKAIWNQRSKYR